MDRPPIIVDKTVLGTLYGKWADHWRGCTVCQHEDWYNPTTGERGLCIEGRRLFRAWVRQTVIPQPQPTRNGTGRGRRG